ncbi:MAG: NACHT domain-containing protein [Elusimicrobia bacterium]|nr:NACHT domain-containing protein [Elusimicrobiota bacterium]
MGDDLTAALLKCDVADSTRLSGECLPLVRDAVEAAVTGYGVEVGFPRWEGDGASAFFLGQDAAARAVRAGLDAVERVRLIPGYEVRLRVAIGVGGVQKGSDLTKVSPQDFNIAGHLAAGDVCPPSAVCVSEDVYFSLLADSPGLAGRFAYLGTTERGGAAAFVSPPGKRPAKPGGLRSGACDVYSAALELRRHYTRPPFSLLRFYALPQFNFIGSLDLISVFTPLNVRRGRADIRPQTAPSGREKGFFPDKPEQAPAEPFSEAFKRHRVLVLLGEPGSGKTTLLRYLAIASSGGRSILRRKIGAAERLLPVHACAADLLKAKRQHHEDGPCRTFARLLAPKTGQEVGMLANAIEERAKAGEALFLIDGLDELAEASDRLDAAQMVEDLAGLFGKSRIVAACRPRGYPGLKLPAGEEYVLDPLSREQARDLTRAFYTEFYLSQKYDESAAKREGAEKGGKLAEALKERRTLAPFTQNPLLLSLAALVHVQLGELPKYRVRLYDVAVQTLVEAWAKARRQAGEAGPVRSVDYDTEGRAVLSALALHMHQDRPGGVMAEADLRKFVAEHLPGKKRGKDPLGDQSRAKDFLARLGEAGSILVERSAGQWAFMHQTFQEYLAAKCLVAKDAQDSLLECLYEPRWEEVVKFTAGELGVVQGRAEEAARFIGKILEGKKDHPAKELGIHVLLAAQCMADTVIEDPDLEDKIISSLRDLLSHGRAPWSEVEKTLRHLRGTQPGDSLAEWISKAELFYGQNQALRALGRQDLIIPDILKTLREDEDGTARGDA